MIWFLQNCYFHHTRIFVSSCQILCDEWQQVWHRVVDQTFVAHSQTLPPRRSHSSDIISWKNHLKIRLNDQQTVQTKWGPKKFQLIWYQNSIANFNCGKWCWTNFESLDNIFDFNDLELQCAGYHYQFFWLERPHRNSLLLVSYLATENKQKRFSNTFVVRKKCFV